MDKQNDVSPERLERIRNLPDEPFEVTLGKARAKARGEVYDPERHRADRPAADRNAAAHNADLEALIGRFMERAKGMPVDRTPEPPRPPTRKAAEVRLEWYIPPRHRDDTLENFKPVTPSQRVALQATRDWIESVKAGEGGALALVGGVGSGKSHLLYAAIRELNLADIHAAAAGWYDLADVFRQAKFGHEEDVTEARKTRWRILSAAALGIDEIRPTSGTEYDTTELSQLMTRAYRERQGIMVTSNYADEKLAKIVGLAAASRLTPIVVQGPDMRKPENHKRHLRAV